jgi:putative ABC transport system permease protein
MLVRDWRGGELTILVAALVLAVGVVAGISAFTTRLGNALEQESHRFLAADLVVSSGSAMPDAWLQEAAALGLASARTLSFPSMVHGAGEGMHLAAVKAVSDAYPLRGELTMSARPYGEALPVPRGPGRGEVWLDSRLFALLGVAIDQRVTVGEAEFKVTAAVRTEPDQAASFYGYGPRVLMHYDDIPATGVVQPGSRVEYRQLYAGPPEGLAQFSGFLESRLGAGQELVTVEEGQPGIAEALARAESFLLLAGSLAVVLAGVAVALAARRFSDRHHDYVAVMKSLGATSAQINRLYSRSLLVLGLVATVCGCALGWGLQALFFELFRDQLPVQPGPSGMRPYAIGAVTSMTCLLCFAWPPLSRLAKASPLRVLRKDTPLEGRRSVRDYLVGLLAVALLMWWYSGDLLLTAALLAGLALTVGLGLVLAFTLLRGGRLVGMSAGSIWRLALAGLQRRGATNALQVVIFAMAIMMLLVLVLLRTSLIDAWQMQLPEDTPNHFMINIDPLDVGAIEALLGEEGIASQPMFSMTRGRIMAVGGADLPATEDRTVDRRQREINLTWSEELPEGNELLQGQWWPADTAEALVSVEDEFAERLGMSVGDTVRFMVGAQSFEVRVANIRALDWQSMQPNFWVVFPPRVLQDYPSTFMTSIHLPQDRKQFLNRFVREFPTVTVIEMDVVVEQIRAIIDQVSAAIELVLFVILLAGALVLVAGVQASVDARMHEGAILRALGARRALLLGGLLIEFCALGLFAGLLATVAAELSVFILQEQVMAMDYVASPWIWPVGLASGACVIGLLGVWSCRRVVSAPPVAVLRDL